MKQKLKLLVILLCSIISTALHAQEDSLITLTDSQAVFYIDEHLEADNLRKDTAKYIRIIKEYKSIIAGDTIQLGFMYATDKNKDKKINSLELKSARRGKICIIEAGAFIFSTSIALLLWHFK